MTCRRDFFSRAQNRKANPFHYQVAPDRACRSRWRAREIDQANRPAAAARSGAGEQGRRAGRDSRACCAGSLPHCGWGAQGLDRALGRVRCIDEVSLFKSPRCRCCRPGNPPADVDGQRSLRHRNHEHQGANRCLLWCSCWVPQFLL